MKEKRLICSVVRYENNHSVFVSFHCMNSHKFTGCTQQMFLFNDTQQMKQIFFHDKQNNILLKKYKRTYIFQMFLQNCHLVILTNKPHIHCSKSNLRSWLDVLPTCHSSVVEHWVGLTTCRSQVRARIRAISF